MPIAGVEGRSSKFAALQACRCDPARYEGCVSVCARARRGGQRAAQPAAAPPRDQLTSLDRRKCPHGVIKLETTQLFWLMSPSAPKAAVARTLLDFAFVPIPESQTRRLGESTYSALMPAALMTGYHFSTSALWKAAKAAGVKRSGGGTCMPRSATRLCASGSAIAARAAAFTLATISAGVFLGPQRPSQVLI